MQTLELDLVAEGIETAGERRSVPEPAGSASPLQVTALPSAPRRARHAAEG